MEPAQIQFIKEVFGLQSHELAKALAVAPITITRWEQGMNTPTGLQAEVLQGLHTVALGVRQSQDHQRAESIRGLVLLGIGALIFYLLSQVGQNH